MLIIGACPLSGCGRLSAANVLIAAETRSWFSPRPLVAQVVAMWLSFRI